uniref:Putative SDR family NAD(P)-dependent oxidoreductase n=1 Tax=viral metagenome TaxID=1070528 RepID=A0A6M3JWK7_9ZZZZ
MNKTVFLTGSGGNLGPIWTEILEADGYKVFGIDLPRYDVRDKIGMLIAKKECISRYGVPNVIINNAAIDPKPQGESGISDNFSDMIDVNLKGAENVIHTFAEDMKVKGGVIINIGSMLGFVAANPQLYPEGFMKPYGYGASKAGLLGLTRNVGVYYGKWGIRCVMLALGPVESDKWNPEFRAKLVQTMPLGRFISKEDLKAGLMFCINSPNFNARGLLIDGGYSAR